MDSLNVVKLPTNFWFLYPISSISHLQLVSPLLQPNFIPFSTVTKRQKPTLSIVLFLPPPLNTRCPFFYPTQKKGGNYTECICKICFSLLQKKKKPFAYNQSLRFTKVPCRRSLALIMFKSLVELLQDNCISTNHARDCSRTITCTTFLHQTDLSWSFTKVTIMLSN